MTLKEMIDKGRQELARRAGEWFSFMDEDTQPSFGDDDEPDETILPSALAHTSSTGRANSHPKQTFGCAGCGRDFAHSPIGDQTLRNVICMVCRQPVPARRAS